MEMSEIFALGESFSGKSTENEGARNVRKRSVMRRIFFMLNKADIFTKNIFIWNLFIIKTLRTWVLEVSTILFYAKIGCIAREFVKW